MPATSHICQILMQAQGESASRSFAELADVSSVSYSNALARPSFSANHSNSHSGQYDAQRPIQGASLHVSQGPTSNYPAFDYSQQWHQLPPNSRTPSHNLLFDQDSPRYETSTSSYVPSSCTSVPNVAAEGTSIFPGLSPLVTHLPAHGGNRTLPDPMAIHSSFDSSNGSMQGNNGDADLYQQHLEMGTSHGSVNSASQDMSAADQASSTTSSPSETQEMPSFGCIPMTQTAASASIENTSGFRSMDASSISHTDSYAASPTSASRNHLPSLNSPYDGYSGHRVSHARNRALEPGMAVRNGSVYDPHGRPRILQPQPRRSPSYDLLKSSFEGSGKYSAKVLRQSGHGRKPDGKR